MKNNLHAVPSPASTTLHSFTTATHSFGIITQHKIITDCLVDDLARPNMRDAVFAAKVQKIHAGGAFVDLGHGQTGWLQTSKQLAAGAVLPVQINAFVDAPKQWPVSAEIKLESPTLIHLPQGKGIHVSAHYVGDAAPLKQQLVGLSGGWIIRRAATAASIAADSATLLARAQNMAIKKIAPALLIPPPSMAERLQNLCGCVATTTAITNPTDIDNELEKLQAALATTLRLPDGGQLIIQQTAALTTIDVDAGNSSNLHATNLAAAQAVAAALRQLNLGGQVVVDFLRTPAPQRTALAKTFSTLLAADRLAITAHGFTKMGLYEITRPRLGPSLLGAVDM